MIDYRANVAALESFRDFLSNEPIADPAIASIRDEHVTALGKAGDMALLGSLVDHLLWHASSDEQELLLVERAASLWRTGVELYGMMTEFRTNLETALRDPAAPAAAQQFNAAGQKFHEFEMAVNGKQAELWALRDDIYNAAHPRAHPRQEDERLADWNWADLFIARRTDAFVRSTLANATDARTRAFSLGVTANYGANACGSHYLGQVVGGPRRSHRHRDRLARNAVGSWFAIHSPGMPSLTDIAVQIRYGLVTPMLPSSIEDLINTSLSDTYDLGRTPPLPDLQLGYRRLIRHLEALDSFAIPPPPSLPMEPFLSVIYGSTSTPPPSVVQMAAELQLVESSGSGSGSGSGVAPKNVPTGSSSTVGEQDSRRSSKLDCGAFFESLWRLVILGGTLFGPCWEAFAEGEDCKLWEGAKKNFTEWWRTMVAGQEPLSEGEHPTDVTASELTEASTSSGVIEVVRSMYETQNQLWEGLNSAYGFLSICGLIYPDALFSRPPYSQFLAIPSPSATGWPHLSTQDSAEDAHEYPTTPLEQPAVTAGGYPPGAAPGAFLRPNQGGVAIGAHVSGAVWKQVAARQRDSLNFDRDADRGLFHPCWTARRSIDDQPIDVVLLDYSDT
jgi:hypothetical protein